MKCSQKHRHNNIAARIFAGLVLSAIGILLIMEQSGIMLPKWLFSFPSFLLVIGLYIQLKQSCKSPFGWILVIVGGLLMAKRIFITGDIPYHDYIIPSLILLIGLRILFPSNKKEQWQNKFEECKTEEIEDSNDFIKAKLVFSGLKKAYLTKKFQGGDINVVFGGINLNLSQCDIEAGNEVVLEIKQVFGGTKLTIPSNWKLVFEVENVLSGIEDKRTINHSISEEKAKVLIIRGSSVLGGIEIKSY